MSLIVTLCPDGFQGAGACYRQCPATQQFEMRTVNGVKHCVYTPDPTQKVELQGVVAIPYIKGKEPKLAPTIASLQTSSPSLFTRYSTEQKRVDEKISIILANIDKQKRLDNAFKSLQSAENARDKAPIAYQQARTAYYTLLKGDTWKKEEQERIAKAEVDPEIRQLKSNLDDASRRLTQQQKTVDVVNGLKHNVLSLKDDFKYSVDTLERQIGKLRDQIIFDRRKREDQDTGSKWDLLDQVLNYGIIATLAFAAFMIYKMIRTPAPTSSETPVTTGGGWTVQRFLKRYVPVPALR